VTQHHDPVHPDEGDHDDVEAAGALLSPDDETFVTTLLGSLPPVAMPPDLADRLDAAIARESAARVAGPDTTPGSATVVPLEAGRGSRRRWAGNRLLQAAAAVVLVVAGGAIALQVVHSRSTSGTANNTAAGSAPPGPQVVSLVDHTGHTYTEANLVSDVRQLTEGTLPTTSSTPQPSTTPGAIKSPTGTYRAEHSPLFTSETLLVPCIAAVEEGGPPQTPVAMDQGWYGGRAVLVVVLPSSADPQHSYDVFIVSTACGQGQDAHLLLYSLVPKP